MKEEIEENPKVTMISAKDQRKKELEALLLRLRKRYEMAEKKDGKFAQKILKRIQKLEKDLDEIGSN
ncbi:MAG: hypothetical protein ACTSPK_00205 [Candidatus Heimdallarchaeota archaeon]